MKVTKIRGYLKGQALNIKPASNQDILLLVSNMLRVDYSGSMEEITSSEANSLSGAAKSPVSYETSRFITIFTRNSHWA